MKRDIKNLNLIVKYCDDVASDIARFGDDIEDLMGDESYQRSMAKSTRHRLGFNSERIHMSEEVLVRFLERVGHDGPSSWRTLGWECTG